MFPYRKTVTFSAMSAQKKEIEDLDLKSTRTTQDFIDACREEFAKFKPAEKITGELENYWGSINCAGYFSGRPEKRCEVIATETKQAFSFRTKPENWGRKFLYFTPRFTGRW